uniref:Uncharacterized protein n=1 Tax=Caldimicrobium thiodismutans TaxID=1653476 RepID=A0A832GM91_9BACT
MECPRLKSLLRDWYQQVRSFTLSPVKMMELVERHIKQCPICQRDEDLPLELDQLREIVRVPHVITVKEEKVTEEPVYIYEEEISEEEEEL